MMHIFTETYVPYEFNGPQDVCNYIKSCSSGLTSAVRVVERDIEHITVRCPVSGSYFDILGSELDLEIAFALMKSAKLLRK